MDSANDNRSDILLVDDEELVRSLLSRSLKQDGYSVSVAGTVKAALERLDAGPCDLLILDKNLPDGSGLSIIEATRNMGIDAEVIVITGYSDTDSAIRAVSLGVFRYVRKPFDLDALRMDINRALETHRLRRALQNRTRELEATNAELREVVAREREADSRRIRAERLATIGSLAAGVAHEINNPLSLLSMTIPYTVNELDSMLRTRAMELDPEHAVAAVERIVRSLRPTQEAVELLMSLSADLHSLGRTEHPDPSPVKLAEVAGSAMRLVRHQLKNKATLVLELPDELTVLGHAKRLVQVFINLLTNAGRAIVDGHPETNEIAVRCRDEGSEVIVEVSDTGVGIPDSNIDRIFDRFFSDNSRGADQGSGIGLSIVREIMKEHAGRVEVRSVEGIGTTFMLRFPRLGDRPSLGSVPAMAVSEPARMIRSRRSILFVEATPGCLHAFERSFGQMHDVYLASDIERAHAELALRHAELDAVVCDTGDGESSMWEFFGQACERHPDLEDRFIFLMPPAADMPQEGASGIQMLQKPVRPASLLAAVYRLHPRRPSAG